MGVGGVVKRDPLMYARHVGPGGRLAKLCGRRWGFHWAGRRLELFLWSADRRRQAWAGMSPSWDGMGVAWRRRYCAKLLRALRVIERNKRALRED